MSSTKIIDHRDLRAELARHGITRREVAEHLGLSYSYVKKILTGIRTAESRREEILKYIDSKRGHESSDDFMRGLSSIEYRLKFEGRIPPRRKTSKVSPNPEEQDRASALLSTTTIKRGTK